MSFTSLQELAERAEQKKRALWEVIAEDERREEAVPLEEIVQRMQAMYQTMKEADGSYDAQLRSASGLAGGDGEKLARFRKQATALAGAYLSEVMEKAVKMAESNACMKRVVAAPTAGSCGVLPAVLLTYEAQREASERRMVEALFVAAGIGAIIAERASISGAEGGCQAEIGAASAMAAGALAYLEGGDCAAVFHAAALALKNLLGLTCDPVAGLVEVPCIKRNASGAVNAVLAAQMALAGVRSAIPPDEVIDSMRRIGKLLPACLRETSEEGLAAAATAQRISALLRKEDESRYESDRRAWNDHSQ